MPKSSKPRTSEPGNISSIARFKLWIIIIIVEETTLAEMSEYFPAQRSFWLTATCYPELRPTFINTVWERVAISCCLPRFIRSSSSLLRAFAASSSSSGTRSQSVDIYSPAQKRGQKNV